MEAMTSTCLVRCHQGLRRCLILQLCMCLSVYLLFVSMGTLPEIKTTDDVTVWLQHTGTVFAWELYSRVITTITLLSRHKNHYDVSSGKLNIHSRFSNISGIAKQLSVSGSPFDVCSRYGQFLLTSCSFSTSFRSTGHSICQVL